MRRILFPMFCAATLMAACGDDATPSNGADATTQDVNSDTVPDTARPDGTTTQPDGTTTQPDGTTTQPDGTTTQPDGTTTQPDGTTQPDTTTGLDPAETCPGINACASACGAADQACQQACLVGKDESGELQDVAQCLSDAGCFDEALSELEALTCQFDECQNELITCFAGIARGAGTCEDLGGCLQGCTAANEIVCSRGCYAATTDAAVVAFFEVQQCISITCYDAATAAEEQACIQAALNEDPAAPGACLAAATTCFGPAGRSAGSAGGGSFNPAKFQKMMQGAKRAN